MEESNRDTDPLDADAAEIDARSPEAAADIEELIEHSEDLGREPDQEVDPDAPVEPGSDR
jgi:hypothetical protein